MGLWCAGRCPQCAHIGATQHGLMVMHTAGMLGRLHDWFNEKTRFRTLSRRFHEVKDFNEFATPPENHSADPFARTAGYIVIQVYEEPSEVCVDGASPENVGDVCLDMDSDAFGCDSLATSIYIDVPSDLSRQLVCDETPPSDMQLRVDMSPCSQQQMRVAGVPATSRKPSDQAPNDDLSSVYKEPSSLCIHDGSPESVCDVCLDMDDDAFHCDSLTTSINAGVLPDLSRKPSEQIPIDDITSIPADLYCSLLEAAQHIERFSGQHRLKECGAIMCR